MPSTVQDPHQTLQEWLQHNTQGFYTRSIAGGVALLGTLLWQSDKRSSYISAMQDDKRDELVGRFIGYYDAEENGQMRPDISQLVGRLHYIDQNPQALLSLADIALLAFMTTGIEDIGNLEAIGGFAAQWLVIQKMLAVNSAVVQLDSECERYMGLPGFTQNPHDSMIWVKAGSALAYDYDDLLPLVAETDLHARIAKELSMLAEEGPSLGNKLG
jgi:hypothetical protein